MFVTLGGPWVCACLGIATPVSRLRAMLWSMEETAVGSELSPSERRKLGSIENGVIDLQLVDDGWMAGESSVKAIR